MLDLFKVLVKNPGVQLTFHTEVTGDCERVIATARLGSYSTNYIFSMMHESYLKVDTTEDRIIDLINALVHHVDEEDRDDRSDQGSHTEETTAGETA